MLSNARTNCCSLLADTSEIQLGGWTLLSAEENVVKSKQFTERVVLLTSSAVYITTFNYDLMKVENFVRIPLTEIMSIQKGNSFICSVYFHSFPFEN